MRKKCIFCQRDDQKITKEHILPDWLSKMYDDSVTGINVGTDSKGKVLYSYTSKVFQQTSNDVCAECNNGWMSNLENEAKPILTKMLKNKSFVLDKKSQSKIANWAMKTLLVMNHNNPAPPQEPIIPRSYYDSFYENKGVTLNSVVLLGHLAPVKLSTGQRLASNKTDIIQHIQVPKELADETILAQKAGKKAFVATLSLGSVVFQLIGQDIFMTSKFNFEVGIPDEPLRVLRPHYTKIRWPLPHTIEEIGGLEVLHEAAKGSPI